MLKDHAKDDRKLSELWAQVNTVPDWVDWQQIKRGQEVFFRYGLPILNVLNFESLLGGMLVTLQKVPPGFDLFLLRGSPSVVKALNLCGGFNNIYVVRKRLLETLQFILQVSESVDAMKPGGVGNISCIRVRLLHAYLRSLICVRESSFSSIIIWLGLPRQGIWLRKQEIDDYLALWRLVAYYLGVPDEPFASQQTARALMESLLVSEVDPINIGRVLARNILNGLENKAPAHASMGFMEAMVRLLNGKQLSDSLQIPQPTLYYRVLIYGYCFFVMALAYGTRLFPKLDQRFIAYRRRYYYTMITDREKGLGGESLFDFVYKPSHAGLLYKAVTVKEKEKIPKTSRRGIEALARVGLVAAFITVVTLLDGGYYVIRIVMRVFFSKIRYQ
ncbi:tat pathway signal sequence [Aspergillus luchuensis IFO 4308]|nr:tat pathway signal sequence [Aspergillus luchuensis IFO 4308]